MHIKRLKIKLIPWIIFSIGCLVFLTTFAAPVIPPVVMGLTWDNVDSGVDRYYIYYSPSLGISLVSTNANGTLAINWAPYTNSTGAFIATNSQGIPYKVAVPATTANQYFFVTSSNIVCESFPSPTATIPPISINPTNASIVKGK